jgi:D-amino-acid dehydrogenase
LAVEHPGSEKERALFAEEERLREMAAMHVVVLGAGVTGATTAYYLTELGHAVTIVERASSVASATSYANGGQLSYSYTDSLAKPEFVPRIPGLVLGLDPAIRVGAWRNLYLAKWGLAFLAQCTSQRARDNTLAVLHIALRSASLLDRLRREVDIEFAFRAAGKLVLLNNAGEIDDARKRASLKREHGCATRIVDYDEALNLEPSLVSMHEPFAAAIYSATDDVGDAHQFSENLIRWLQTNRDVTLRLNESVESLDVHKGKLQAIRTDTGLIAANASVVCLGPWSRTLLKPLGIAPPIYPVRGYSVTLPLGEHSPLVSVTHLDQRIVFSRLGSQVRIAGFADFVGYQTRNDHKRLARMLDIARNIAPGAADYDAVDKSPWGGFRPVTPSSRPIVGASPVSGLFLNVGHGVLGWTLACATGHDVAAAVSQYTQ